MNTWPMADLLPHSDDMILLDAVVQAGDEQMTCCRRVRRGDMFSDADGNLPAWCGIELMAQAVAAWAGWQARCEQRPVRLGFLLGSRHYRCNVDVFPLDTELTVEAVRQFHDDSGMAMFACRIDADGIHAEARLTVFSPPNSDSFLASNASEPNA